MSWTPDRRIAVCAAGAAALSALLACASAAPALIPRAGTRRASSPSLSREGERLLVHSHELWATIDVCSPPDQHDTVGVRGSMPGDGHPHDSMWMSFRLQYMTAGRHWVDITSAANPEWELVGNGASARQGGSSFALKPDASRAAARLRGVVDFQWRRGHTVLLSTAQPTTKGHKSLAGADPANYSAAECMLG